MPFKGDVSFQDVRIPPGSKTDPVVQALIKELNRTHAKLNSLITSLERTSSGSSTVVVLGGSSSSGSGGSSGIAVTLIPIVYTVVAGTNNVPFGQTLSTTNYAIAGPRTYGSDGRPTSYGKITKSTSRFTIEEVSEAGTLECVVVLA